MVSQKSKKMGGRGEIYFDSLDYEILFMLNDFFSDVKGIVNNLRRKHIVTKHHIDKMISNEFIKLEEGFNEKSKKNVYLLTCSEKGKQLLELFHDYKMDKIDLRNTKR